MSEMRSCTLGDVIALGNGKTRPDEVGNIPVFGGNGVLGYSNKANYSGKSIVIGRVGAYCGSVYYSDEPIWVSDNALHAKAKDGNDTKFLYYLLKQIDLNQYAEGSSHPLVTQRLLNAIEAFVPPLPEQKAIAEVLGCLDDKIELLHQQNKILDIIAKGLFYTHVIETSVELEKRPLDSIATFLNGLALQKYPPTGLNDLPVIKIRELNQGITVNTESCSGSIPLGYLVNNGDILFSWSGSLTVKLWSEGIGALNQHLFKVTSEHFPDWFVYYATLHHLPEFQQIAESKATTMGHIQRKHLTEALVPIPTRRCLENLNESIEPIFSKIKSNNAAIHMTEQIRNNLLPKLMTGEATIQ